MFNRRECRVQCRRRHDDVGRTRTLNGSKAVRYLYLRPQTIQLSKLLGADQEGLGISDFEVPTRPVILNPIGLKLCNTGDSTI